MPSASPRILLFTDADVFAGTERHILDLALALRDQSVAVHIASPSPSPLAAHCATHQIPHVVIQKTGLLDRPAIATLRQLLRSNQIDIIHSHNGRTALSAAIATRRFPRSRCILTQHFVEPSHVHRTGAKALLSNVAHQWMNRRTSHFVAISNAVSDAMLARNEVPRNKITVIPNGIADSSATALTPPQLLRDQLQIPRDAPLIVSVARLEKEKDLSSLITAMHSVLKSHNSAHCLIAGDGALRATLQNQITSLSLNQQVHLLGFRPDALSLINASDVFVLPSLAEPFGLVLLEAMSLSKPVIATNCAGPLEIVRDNQTGLLVRPANPSDLAHAIQTLLSNPALRHEMGTQARVHFQSHFTSARMATDMLALYQRVLS